MRHLRDLTLAVHCLAPGIKPRLSGILAQVFTEAALREPRTEPFDSGPRKQEGPALWFVIPQGREGQGLQKRKGCGLQSGRLYLECV